MTTRDTGPEDGHGSSPPTVEEMAAEFGRFEVYELLGYGGMGACYRSIQESMGRMVREWKARRSRSPRQYCR